MKQKEEKKGWGLWPSVGVHLQDGFLLGKGTLEGSSEMPAHQLGRCGRGAQQTAPLREENLASRLRCTQGARDRGCFIQGLARPVCRTVCGAPFGCQDSAL